MDTFISTIIFVGTYISIILFRKYSLIFIVLALLLLYFFGMSLSHMLNGINFNVLGIFLGTMILSELFIYSEVPGFLASKIMKHTRDATSAFLAICALSAFISAFTENIATVFIVAPLALEISRRLKINPAILLIAVSISSNLQGTSTLIGDAPSIILAMKTGMTFNDFFWIHGRPGIFFAIQVGAIGAFIILYLFFKKYKQKCESTELHKVKTWIPTILMSLMTIHLAIEPLLPFHFSLAVICLFWGFIALTWYFFQKNEKISLIKQLDWHTLIFLIGIFILVHSLAISGVINILADTIYTLSMGNPLKAYVIIILFSIIISAFVDNIPYTIAMIPVAQTIALKTGSNSLLFVYGLLIGTCLGGNITPIGSASNVVTLGILNKNNIKFKTMDFLKIGLPFTFVAVLFSSVFIWFIFK